MNSISRTSSLFNQFKLGGLLYTRTLHVSQRYLQQGSLFSNVRDPSVGKTNEEPSQLTKRINMTLENGDEQTIDKGSIGLKNDKTLQEFIKSKRQLERPATSILLSPLKKQIYEENCKINGGFYQKDTIVTLPNSDVKYKLNLTNKEIEVLEPSVRVSSYRIKSSMKKATHLLRMLSGLDLKDAITQCHFSERDIARDVAEMLERGVEDAKTLGVDPDDLYVAQIWSGSDGEWLKRVDIKGRARMGIIRHRYIHVRGILKSKKVTKRRLEKEEKLRQEKRKPWVQLADKPIRGVTGGVYKW
ncbi:hypothetical protein KAFR_0A07510 [Kazachstania africana CBS 2517]|uniref:Ribosomal protein L22 n=1 Tax=Kazachstania africana (strain ATCC 22294 / BCRC 22015 / CBS 2517 / CECT 1963 / NBRC 1671 / NRRL Y-8276) TaxID=1071382 RepID=H2AP85_KAZAF|nr:hypothetical protein KAFR_0A07510 [Kazachstania africana CBS 2517]CCF56185.1 hypothetical protein KAFR_0A07510 [Kazachstania africana CBS 2517]